MKRYLCFSLDDYSEVEINICKLILYSLQDHFGIDYYNLFTYITSNNSFLVYDACINSSVSKSTYYRRIKLFQSILDRIRKDDIFNIIKI